MSSEHTIFLKKAIELAEQCRNVPFYGVGCVIISSEKLVVSTGYTGERKTSEGNRVTFQHAEEIALAKAQESNISLEGATLYSTLEPCSERKSTSVSCCALILKSHIQKVVFGSNEPLDPELNIICQGQGNLRNAGLEVIQLQDLADVCLSVALKNRAQKQTS